MRMRFDARRPEAVIPALALLLVLLPALGAPGFYWYW